MKNTTAFLGSVRAFIPAMLLKRSYSTVGRSSSDSSGSKSKEAEGFFKGSNGQTVKLINKGRYLRY